MKQIYIVFFIGVCVSSNCNSESFSSIVSKATMPATNETHFYIETQDPDIATSVNQTRCFAFPKDEDDYCETSGLLGVPQWSSGSLYGELAYTWYFYPTSDDGKRVDFYSKEDAVCAITIDGEKLDTSVSWKDYKPFQTAYRYHYCAINTPSLDLWLSALGSNAKKISRFGNPRNVKETVYRLTDELDYFWSYLLLHHSAISNERTAYKPFWLAVRLVAFNKPAHLWRYTSDRIKVWFNGPLTEEQAKKILCDRGEKYNCKY
ncbi:hypothetical protein N8Z80_07290 [Litorivicinus sp.]|nr:hypothetical protein [Litorivicinus sp.]